MAELTPDADRAFTRANDFAENVDDDGNVDAIVIALRGVALEVAALREATAPAIQSAVFNPYRRTGPRPRITSFCEACGQIATTTKKDTSHA